MIDTLLRFLIGGLVISAFATVGGLFKPTSFAGLFGAAPFCRPRKPRARDFNYPPSGIGVGFNTLNFTFSAYGSPAVVLSQGLKYNPAALRRVLQSGNRSFARPD